MNRKKIVNLISIAVLIAFVVAASVISYSIATRNNESGSKNIEAGLTNVGAGISGNMGYTTNIDMIISNSYDGETFNVVEIVPAGVASSGLDTYISSGSFASYVINENKDTESREMNTALSPNVKYTLLNVNSTTSLSDAAGTSTYQEILDAADLIYVSSPTYTSYSGTNNMSEDVYNWLHTYSLGTYRPIIMDYVTSAETGNVSTKKKFQDLVNAVSGNYIRYRTFYWDSGLTAEQFFSSASGSYYLKYNTNSNTPNGKILVIGTGWMNETMQGIAGLAGYMYFGKNIPSSDSLVFENLAPGDVTADNISGYDFVIIENSAMNVELSTEAYNALKTLSETSKYIIYDKANIKQTTSEVDMTSSNYLKLMNLLITNKGVARYSSVMPVSYGYFNSLNSAGEDGKDSAKNIADLINASDYRGSLTSGANGKVYRVLELQPCYPIDLDLAMEQKGMKGQITGSCGWLGGNYYTNPGQMLFGVSEDQVDGETEYYKFELSKAKLVKALGLRYNQIQIDQMSTEEFISRKEVVLETYDLIYIGGNVTALTPYTMKSFYSGNYGAITAYQTYAITRYLTTFDMYTHTGNISQLFTYASQTSSNAGNAYGTIDGANVTNVRLNGNDITLNKYNELKAYIDAGMPIMFSQPVCEAYGKIEGKSRTEQLSAHDIDPDSRMYKLLEYAKKKADGSAVNVLWNMDITSYGGQDDYNYNEDNKYGPALTQYVTLFNDGTEQAILSLVEQSETRPSLRITTQPKNYIQGNVTTYNDNKDGTMSITAKVAPSGGETSANFTLQLLIDKDGNGTFDPEGVVEVGNLKTTELVDTKTCSYTQGGDNTVTLTYPFDYDDFFGLVSWKVVATQEGSKGARDVASGYAYFKRKEETDKKEVDILQIMPMEYQENPGDNYGQSDGHSLYLCTECQMAKYRAKYNLTSNGDIYLNVSGVKSSFGNVDKMGKHEHKFGIVKYDTAGQITSATLDKGTGSEDWDSNYADILNEDYDFSTTILFTNELDEYTKVIAGNTDADGKLTTTTVDEDGNAFGKDEDGNDISMTWVDYYTAKADDYYTQWESAKLAMESSGTEAALIAFLEKLRDGAPYTISFGGNPNYVIDKAKIQQWIDHKAYYMYFIYWSYYGDKGKGSYIEAYTNWVPYHDAVVEAHENYMKYSCYSYTSTDWLYNNYDIVVLGFAEDFGGKDLTVQECQDIKDYLAVGGSVLTTHDTTSRYATSGSYTLTNELRSTFGIDRFHITKAEYNTSGTYTATSKDIKEIFLMNGQNFYGPIYLTDSHVEVDIILDQAGGYVDATTGSNVAHIYPVAKTTATSPASLGSNFNVKFNIYQDEAAYASGARISGTNQFEIRSFDPWGWRYMNPVNTTNGEGTYSQVQFTASSISGLPKYPNYITADPEKYYFTELSVIGSATMEERVLWQSKLSGLSVGNGNTYYGVIAPVGITDAVGIFETTSNNSSPYKYIEYNQQSAITWNKDLTQKSNSGTSRASQVNTGIVTTYPFTISSELIISGTHCQTYALDLEDSAAAVWYTLAGCEGAKDRASLFAATPYDGMDAYFLYSYQVGKGTVNYCGAGHTVVTGPEHNNNDERMLYMNVIVNAVRNKGSKPKITVHEKDKPNKTLDAGDQSTNPYLTEDGEYIYSVYSKDDIPEMDYKIKVNSQTSLAEVYVFFDLNYGTVGGDYSNKYTADANHALIYHYLGTNYDGAIKDGIIEEYATKNAAGETVINRDAAGRSNPIVGKLKANLYMNDKKEDVLQLKPEYFDPYGDHTYLVIWAKDSNGKTSYQRIRIELVPFLFDLTDAEFNYMLQYYEPYSNGTDVTDKIKFKL